LISRDMHSHPRLRLSRWWKDHLLLSFLTTEANDVVRPVHAKAMPVILADETAWHAWLEADLETALKLQQPLPANRLAAVATGQK
jgi:putative SOS response-associated peptidase YedK